MTGFSTSELALLLYQAAQDKNRWPALVAALQETANPFDDDAIYQNPVARRELLEQLLPHIRQALDMADRFESQAVSQNLLDRTLEMLPMGVALLDDRLNIIMLNQQADRTLAEHEMLANHDGHFRINNREQHKLLHHYIAQSLKEGSSHALMLCPGDPRSVSLLVCPADLVKDRDDNDPPAVTLFLSNPDFQSLIDEQTLIDLYQLSAAEADLTRDLIHGYDLRSIAQRRQVSEQTVRTQLKSVFRKTETARQAELVSLVLSGLAPLRGRESVTENVADEIGEVTGLRYCKGAHGQRLCFAEYGDPQGVAVMFCHSVRGSRLEVPGGDSVLRDMHIRLIIVERPGYGESETLTERTVDDLAEDMRCLADHLELPQFHLLGYSLGGFLALHCAARLGDRVSRLGLVSSLAPPGGEAGKPLKGMMRLAVALADKAPGLAETVLDHMARTILKNPRRHLGSSVDRKLLAEPDHQERYLLALRESCRQGSMGFVQDLQAVARTPLPEPSSLTLPVYLWHGEQDGQVPADQAIQLDRWLTNSELTLLPDGGHFFIYSRWPQILASFVAE